MNVNGYGLNLQYQKTQLAYDMTLSKVDANEKTQELADENEKISESNLPIVYMNEDDLSSSDILMKMILEATYSQYSSSSASQSLIPNVKTTNSDDIPEEIQSYANNQANAPIGVAYTASSEYYEKTSFEFSGEIKIVTPEGEYMIELNLSYSHEFYEKNETFVQTANENLQSPLEIMLDEDSESLKSLSTISLYFDTIQDKQAEAQYDFFTKLEEYLLERQEYKEEMIERKDIEKKEKEDILEEKREAQMDNFQVYMSRNEESFQLVSAQKDGLGVFLAQTQSESSYLNIATNENGSYISAGYSSSTTSISSFEAKA